MSHDAYDADRPLMLRCACGADHAPGEHAARDVETATAAISWKPAW
jgi:nitrate/nitrite transport system substrate-binding protein